MISKIRYNYWSNSNLSKMLNNWAGIQNLPWATAEEWDEWEIGFKNKAPVVYFITQKCFDKIQDVVYYPHDVYSSIRSYIDNRFIDKTHTIATNLEKGEYHGHDVRMLHGMFELLVDFVETRHHTNKGRSAEAGLDHLNWEMTLTDSSPIQAEHAKEKYELYLWWTTIRPARPDPQEASGLDDWYNSTNLEGGFLSRIGKLKVDDPDAYAEYRTLCDTATKIEQQYEQEDCDMLIRLVKIRTSMW